jgi:hypothetical protein
MYGLPMGASNEGELHISWMKRFPIPFMNFIFYSYLFLFQEAS